MMKLSDKILALRKKRGMSQEELAERLNVSRQAVSRWEMGSAQPDASNLLQLSRLFGVSADYLLDDGYEENQKEAAESGIPEKNQKAFTESSISEKCQKVSAGSGIPEQCQKVSAESDIHGRGQRISVPGAGEPAKRPHWGRFAGRIAGLCAAVIGLLGNMAIYILSRIFLVPVPWTSYDESGRKWYHWSGEHTGRSYVYFIQHYRLELLAVLFWVMAAAGLALFFLLPVICQERKDAIM